VANFRYRQFCALARAAEILCERWNLLIIRELLFGPRRFGDLRKGLGEVSPSVLSERLDHLESVAVIRKTELPPPASCAAYELDEAGTALLPAIRELGRWGARFLLPLEEGERPSAASLGAYLRMLACESATPPVRLNLQTADDGGTYLFHIHGSDQGTSVTDGAQHADALIHGPAIDLLAAASGFRTVESCVAAGTLSIDGNRVSVLCLPKLFRSCFPPAKEHHWNRKRPNQGETA